MSNHQNTFKADQHERDVLGKFTTMTRTESPVTLGVPAYSDPTYDAEDQMVWEVEGDEYGPVYTNKIGGIEASIGQDIRGEGGWSVRAVDYRGNRPKVLKGSHESFETLDEAKAYIKPLRAKALRYGVNNLSVDGKSPWGEIQSIEPIAPGIDAVFTDGHGGLKLSSGRQGEIHPAWRQRGGWYEEDCAFSIAYITHHEDIEPRLVELAHESARRWYPDAYEKVVGKNPAKFGIDEFKPITAEESPVVRDREFYASRAETHVQFVSLDREPEGRPGMIAFELDDLPADGKNLDVARNRRTVIVPEGRWNDVAGHVERGTFPKGIIE